MDRQFVIQSLIEKRKFKTYLEVGVLEGSLFFAIKCRNKIAVDPNFKFDWKVRLRRLLRNGANLRARFFETTSEEFFSNHAVKTIKMGSLDIVFIDGMHEFKYALNDVLNSLRFLSNKGIIIMHDCNPQSKEAACSFQEWKERGFNGYWNGDVWKVITYLISTRSDLDIFVSDCDHGLGIIQKSKRQLTDSNVDSLEKVSNLTYEYLNSNRSILLNLKSESYLEEFILKR